MRKKVIIYTDGACSGNPGPGGWGAILIYGERTRELSGGEGATTNQRMELTAVLQALKALKVKDWDVVVHSDSAYVVNAVKQGWLEKWRTNGWINSKKEAVANRDLWLQLLDLMGHNRVDFKKVAGHSGDARNERCDELARRAIKALYADHTQKGD